MALALITTACSPKVVLFGDRTEPLQERVLRGEGEERILLLPVSGVITNAPDAGLFRRDPGTVESVVAQLEKAREDERIKAVVLTVNSPGGGATASNALYHELRRYREQTGVVVVACLLDVAASGGYYAALAADRIVAHPNSVTGSVGTVFLTPKITGLLDKLGVEVEVAKSGDNKDMVSPFSASNAEQRALVQDIVENMNARFLAALRQSRNLDKAQFASVADARIMTADQALEFGLVDEVGQIHDAFAAARHLAGLPQATVIAYRRTEFADDTVYNPLTTSVANTRPTLVDFGPAAVLNARSPGFFHIWLPGLE
jgi:protease-4